MKVIFNFSLEIWFFGLTWRVTLLSRYNLKALRLAVLCLLVVLAGFTVLAGFNVLVDYPRWGTIQDDCSS